MPRDRERSVDLKSGYPFWAIRNGLMAAAPPLRRDLRVEVLVVGAGISGALIADELSRHGHAVELFCSTNEKLIESLQRVAGPVSQSVARSAEHLNYYVAQAREVLDLSITSQQGILEDMHRLQRQAIAKAESEGAA